MIVIGKKEFLTEQRKRRSVLWVCRCSCGNIVEVEGYKLKSGHVKSCGCGKKGPRIDHVGEKFGLLTFLKPDPDAPGKWICQCDCGNLTSVVPNNVIKGLTTSCGCRQKEIISQKLTKDLTGMRFGRLTVLRKDNSKNDKSGVRWVCKCDCGNEKSIRSCSLVSGNSKSCGCLKSEVTSKRFTKNLIGLRFGKLLVIKRAGTYKGEDGTAYAQWLCECECGGTKLVRGHDLIKGNVTSCGCTISRGEEKVRKVLISEGVKYDTQYSFGDLRSSNGGKLRFDFAIKDSKEGLLALIEYQGQQHYDDSYGYFGKQQREETDLLKRKYCEKNNIKLFE